MSMSSWLYRRPLGLGCLNLGANMFYEEALRSRGCHYQVAEKYANHFKQTSLMAADRLG